MGAREEFFGAIRLASRTNPSLPHCAAGTLAWTRDLLLPAIWASGERQAAGTSSRSILGHIHRRLVAFARYRRREDLAAAFVEHSAIACADIVARAIDTLRHLPVPAPRISDEIGAWLPPRIVAALQVYGIRTLAELTVRIPRRRRWWTAIDGLGIAGARRRVAVARERLGG